MATRMEDYMATHEWIREGELVGIFPSRPIRDSILARLMRWLEDLPYIGGRIYWHRYNRGKAKVMRDNQRMFRRLVDERMGRVPPPWIRDTRGLPRRGNLT